MSDNERDPIQDPIEDEEELDFSSLKKKKKSKKKVEFEDDIEEASQTATPDNEANEEAVDEEDPEQMFADLKMKKKKKKVKSEDAPEADEEGTTGADDDLQFGELKKKKKKKKNMAEFEAELGDNADGEDVFTGETESAKAKDGEESWSTSDRDYTYSELLSRAFKTLRQNNPELAGEKKRYTIVPPSIAREGNKKTIFANVADISKRMHRNPEHVIQFLFAELGTSGSVDGAQRLIIKGRFQQKQIENVLRHYIVDYVTCKTCKSPDTILHKDNRLYFVQCEACGSSRSVTAIKTGFKAQTKEDRRAAKRV
ncbi:translation initiation factor eIF-2 beta subunit [Umbelopsis nana]